MLFKMSKQLRVRKRPKTGRIIGHCIGGTGNVVVTKTVAVVALVKTSETEEVGDGVTGRDGTFGGTTDGRGVVVEDRESAFTGVNRLGKNVLVGDDASKFEVTVGEVTARVVIGNQAGLDVRGEGGAPQERRGAINKPHATHTRFGSINGTDARGKVGNNFSKPGGTKVQVGSKGFEIIKLGTDMGIKADTVAIGMKDAGLEGAEKAPTARDC
jgi:hypothetical protein